MIKERSKRSQGTILVLILLSVPLQAFAFEDMQDITDMEEYYSMFDDAYNDDDAYSDDVGDEALNDEIDDVLETAEKPEKKDEYVDYADSDYYGDEDIDTSDYQALSEW